MENKINIAELLKDCPKGMELDCTMYDNCTYAGIEDVGYIDILINTPSGRIRLTKEGCYIRHDNNAKCAIFPKGKTTWEGFVPPCKFKTGDVIFTHANCLKVGLGNTWISIFQEKRNGGVATYVDMSEDGEDYYDYIDGDKALLCMDKDIMRQRLATEEEKQRLFDAIKANGYKWNAETKTLEKLVKPKFKVGDRVKHISAYTPGIVVKVDDKGYHIYYPKGEGVCYINFILEKDYELAPNKFDITTLKPFESRVLVRDFNNEEWCPAIWGVYGYGKEYPHIVVSGNNFIQCIPYEKNEHLLGTTNDCDDYYKTWR